MIVRRRVRRNQTVGMQGFYPLQVNGMSLKEGTGCLRGQGSEEGSGLGLNV